MKYVIQYHNNNKTDLCPLYLQRHLPIDRWQGTTLKRRAVNFSLAEARIVLKNSKLYYEVYSLSKTNRFRIVEA